MSYRQYFTRLDPIRSQSSDYVVAGCGEFVAPGVWGSGLPVSHLASLLRAQLGCVVGLGPFKKEIP